MDLVRADPHTTPARSVAGMGDHPCAMALYGAIVTALFQREKTGKGTKVSSNLMANGLWANGVMAQAKLVGAKFHERYPRERALNAVTNHYRCGDDRWLILSLLNEDKQFPILTERLGITHLLDDPRFTTTPLRHRHSQDLIAILDALFATQPLAHWRKTLDGSGIIFGIVGVLDDLDHDQQMRDAGVLVPFENSQTLTITSPIWVEGAEKVTPRMPPKVGEHSDDILKQAGFSEAEISALRGTGAVA
jgi:formyl-CoA transferase